MFVEAVDDLLEQFQYRLGTEVAVPWGWLFEKLLNLLSRYPTGVTKAILFAELQTSWIKIAKKPSYGPLHGVQHLRSIVLTKKLSPQAVFEVSLQKVIRVEGTRTRIGILREWDARRGKCFSMKMYLHEKLVGMVHEIMAYNYKLRFTGCRFVEGPKQTIEQTERRIGGSGPAKRRKQNLITLLPAESLVILINDQVMGRISKDFTTMEGLDYSKPHYLDKIKVKVTEIGKPELFHHPNGQTVDKMTVVVVDDLGVHAKFVFWQEYVLMGNLLEEDDTLLMKRCFLVPDPNETFVLNYGPETIIYCYRVIHEPELVPSQSDRSRMLYVFKDSKGKLDYSMYPEQLGIRDIKAEMTNLTLCGQVVFVGPKKLLEGDGISKVEYQIKVRDDSGICTVVVRERFKGGGMVYPGQFVFMNNLLVTSHSAFDLTLHLNYEKGGKLWNASALQGWIATSAICSITSVASLNAGLLLVTGHCVIRGEIFGLKARKSAGPIVRVHCPCNTELVEDINEKLCCSECGSRDMVEMPVGSASKLVSLDQYWCWQYKLRILIIDSDKQRVRVNIRNEAAEKLFQLPARQLQPLEEDGRLRVFNCTFGQEYRFGLSNFNGEILVGVVSRV